MQLESEAEMLCIKSVTYGILPVFELNLIGIVCVFVELSYTSLFVCF